MRILKGEASSSPGSIGEVNAELATPGVSRANPLSQTLVHDRVDMRSADTSHPGCDNRQLALNTMRCTLQMIARGLPAAPAVIGTSHRQAA
jgi:hypothetical protein